jgi:hypothetical protein
MRLSTDELRRLALLLLEHVDAISPQAVEIDDDFYWDVPAEARYDAYGEPKTHTVGQLSDDWRELQRLLKGERPPIGHALVWLAAILRRIGERTP